MDEDVTVNKVKMALEKKSPVGKVSEVDHQHVEFVNGDTSMGPFSDAADNLSIPFLRKTRCIEFNSNNECGPVIVPFPFTEENSAAAKGASSAQKKTIVRCGSPIITPFPDLTSSSPAQYSNGNGTFGRRAKSIGFCKGSAEIIHLQNSHVSNTNSHNKSYLEYLITKTKKDVHNPNTQECSFHPKINAKSEIMQREDDTSMRLYNLNKALKQKQKEAEAKSVKEKAAREVSGCTFKPKINSEKGKSKVKEDIRSGMLNRKVADATPPPCSFHPETNKVPKNMSKVQEYLKSNPYRRLTAGQGENKSFITANSPKQEDSSVHKAFANESKVDLEEFLVRMEGYERKRKEKQKKMKEGVGQLNKKLINKKSEELTKSMVNFLERNQRLETIKVTQKMLVDENETGSCTFQPEITRYAQNAKRKTIAELAYAPTQKKQEKLIQMKEQIDAAESSACTFVPDVSRSKKYYGVRSKLHLKGDTSSYIGHLNQEKEMKKIMQDAREAERIIQEMSECTYTPKINPKPTKKPS